MLTSVETNRQLVRKPQAALAVVQPDPNRAAVMLNRNARKVNDKIARKLERIIGKEHFFYSRSIEEAEAITREIVQRGYGTILSGGGDGTLSRAVNLVQRYVDESNEWRRERASRYGERQTLLGMPRFGILKLGTGNGLTDIIGAGNPVRDLKNIVEFSPGRTHEIPLIESDGERFFFGGVGYDSMILSDYTALKREAKTWFTRKLFAGLGGYFGAVLLKSTPRVLFGENALEARVITNGRAYYVDPRRGDAAIELKRGSTLFEGKSRLIGVGTSPFYGFGFRIFPFASIQPGMMHLRITDINPIAALLRLHPIWKGSYRDPKHIMDFLVEDISIELANPYPFQHSGDAQGMRSRVDMRVADEPLRLVDCHHPKHLVA